LASGVTVGSTALAAAGGIGSFVRLPGSPSLLLVRGWSDAPALDGGCAPFVLGASGRGDAFCPFSPETGGRGTGGLLSFPSEGCAERLALSSGSASGALTAAVCRPAPTVDAASNGTSHTDARPAMKPTATLAMTMARAASARRRSTCVSAVRCPRGAASSPVFVMLPRNCCRPPRCNCNRPASVPGQVSIHGRSRRVGGVGAFVLPPGSTPARLSSRAPLAPALQTARGVGGGRFARVSRNQLTLPCRSMV
jgi:hypothetical protein